MNSKVQKYLEKIRTYRANEHYKRAMQLVEEASREGLSGPELTAQGIGLGLIMDPWMQVLNRLGPALAKYPLGALCGGENRRDFLRTVREYSGFRTELMEVLLNLRSLGGIKDWINLSEGGDRNWLIKSWLEMAEGEKNPPRAALMAAATGVGYFVMDDWENAWHRWSEALARDAGLLQRILTICKTSKKMDMHQPAHRLRFIQLIAAAGKKLEAMSLLQALGLDHQDNARSILDDMPAFIPFPAKSREVAKLRFNLALFLKEPETLFRVISEMDYLEENDLFQFKKQARARIKNPVLRRSALLEFVRIHIRKSNWENAAHLLETLYDEEPHSEIVNLMEHVVDHYPIMSQLNFIVGKYYLERGYRERALSFLDIILEVPKYRKNMTTLLEDILVENYDVSIAERLLKLLPQGSHKVCLVALLVVMNEGEGCRHVLEQLDQWKGRKQPSPLWYLAMLHGTIHLKKYERTYELLCDFLLSFIGLSQEALKCAETLAANYRADFSRGADIIETFLSNIKPRADWIEVRHNFEEATYNYQAQPVPSPPGTSTAAEQPIPSSAESLSTPVPVPEEPSQGVTKSGEEISAVSARTEEETEPEEAPSKTPEEAELARTAPATVTAMPGKAPEILKKLEDIAATHPRDPLWVKTMLRVMIAVKDYSEAVKLGQKAVAELHFQGDLPELYQLLAQAFMGMAHHAEALRFFCLASRESHFYHENRIQLITMVFPKNNHLLKEVLQLVLANEDQETWQQLMTNWHRHFPEEIHHLIQAQIRFTHKVETAKSIVDLAFWYLQAGKVGQVTNTLNRIDLRDPEIRESLIHITNLASLKYPEDPKPKFILARYYLFHKDVSRAVDTFRNMAGQAPDTANPIFRFLRTYLKKNPETIGPLYLYGLLIRFTLSYGTPIYAVKLLDELAQTDKEGAESLIDGVFRVLLRKKEKPETIFELGKFLWKLGAYKKMLKVNEQGDLGTHMAYERLKWLEDAQSDPKLKDRAILAAARLWFDILEFDSCRKTLETIRDHRYRRQALHLYNRLTTRFPDQMDLWREAAWAAFTEDKEKALEYFRKIYEDELSENHIEAFAALSELGAAPSFEQLQNITEDKNRLFSELSAVHDRIREIELAHWEETDGPVPIRSLEWLLTTGRLVRFQAYLPKIEALDDARRIPLEARYMLARGQAVQAAWRLSQADAPTEMIQSFFHGAGMTDRAVFHKKPRTRLPEYLREAFLQNWGKPQIIVAHYHHVHQLHQANKVSLEQTEET